MIRGHESILTTYLDALDMYLLVKDGKTSFPFVTALRDLSEHGSRVSGDWTEGSTDLVLHLCSCQS